MRKRGKTYYVCYIISKEDIIISVSMTYIADSLEVSQRTIARHLKNSDVYKTNDYIIWKNVGINGIKRGFALKKSKYIV